MSLLLVIFIIVFLGLSGVRIAQEYQRGVVFQLGRYKGLRGPGMYWIMPLGIERSVTIDIRRRNRRPHPVEMGQSCRSRDIR